MTRVGKIARLPAHLRLEINHRLRNGRKGRDIIAWLNSLEEVRKDLSIEFDKPEITENNLVEWKRGGYREWEAQESAMEAARRTVESAGQLEETSPKSLADRMAVWITARYMMAARLLVEKADPKRGWKMLRELCHDVAMLRRGDHGAEWLRLEEERVKLLREKRNSEPRKEKEGSQPEPALPPMDDAEKERQFREIFGMEPIAP